MEKTLWQFIWRYSRIDQFKVLALTVISFPFLYLSLEMPKIIINAALKPGKIDHDLGDVITIGPEWFLWLLCGLFMASVMASGSFKMRINTMKGVMGERMLRRLRYQMVHNILRFPASRFHGTSAGELVSMLNAETEPVAGYAGDALALPAFQGGTLLTILTFMFVQDIKLGLAALVAMPLQIFFIPRLQRQINALARQRVQQARQIAARLDETVAGIDDIRINAVQEYVLAQFSWLFAGTFNIRFEIYQKKFLMKFLNNAMAQITPFLFFAVGGYQVLEGHLTLGALVAALSAQKELYAPWKELLNFYQTQQDTRTKYDQLYEQFNPPDMIVDPIPPAEGINITGNGSFIGLGLNDNSQTLDLEIKPGCHYGFTSDDLILLDELAALLVRRHATRSGRIMMDGHDLDQIPAALWGPAIGYVGPDSYIFEGTLLENVFFSAFHTPPALPNERIQDPSQRSLIQEAAASGNSLHLMPGNWTDMTGLGLEDDAAARSWWQQIATTLDMDDGLIDALAGDFRTGLAGARLTLAGRQKLALARAIAKKPRWLVAHRPLQALPPMARQHIRLKLQVLLPETVLFWIDHLHENDSNFTLKIQITTKGFFKI